MEGIRYSDCSSPIPSMDCWQDGTVSPGKAIFGFQLMYIGRRGDIVGLSVWKSTILHIISKSELSVLETVAV